MQNQPMDFTITKYRQFSNFVSCSALQLPRSSHLSNSSAVSKNIQNYTTSAFSDYMSARGTIFFLFFTKKKQKLNAEVNYTHKKSCLLLNQIVKEFAKCKTFFLLI